MIHTRFNHPCMHPYTKQAQTYTYTHTHTHTEHTHSQSLCTKTLKCCSTKLRSTERSFLISSGFKKRFCHLDRLNVWDLKHSTRTHTHAHTHAHTHNHTHTHSFQTSALPDLSPSNSQRQSLCTALKPFIAHLELL